MVKIFTRSAGPKALVTVIQGLVNYQRSGILEADPRGLSPGVNYAGLNELLQSGVSPLDVLQEVIDEYTATVPTVVLSSEAQVRLDQHDTGR